MNLIPSVNLLADAGGFVGILRGIFAVVEMLFIFNLLIIVHELGHFLAAKWRGLVVEEFAIWFGKAIWRKKIGGVWFSMRSIPFGGYVKLPQLGNAAAEGKSETDEAALPAITPLDKIIVAFAGPLFSFLLAVFFALLVFGAGRPMSESESTTVIGKIDPDGPAAAAGLKPGDKLVEIDGKPVRRWGGMARDGVVWRIVRSEGEVLPVKYERDGVVNTVQTTPVIPKTEFWERKGLRQLQMGPAYTPLVGKVKPGSEAEKAGIQAGDMMWALEGKKILGLEDISAFVRAHPGEKLPFTVHRKDKKTDTITALEAKLSTLGAEIGDVQPGSPAEQAGLKAGDVVIAMDGLEHGSTQLFTEHVKASGGKAIKVKYLRNGVAGELSLTPTVPEGEDKPRIGLVWGADDHGVLYDPYGIKKLVHPHPVDQIVSSAVSIFDTLEALFSQKSKVSVQHMGGAVMMMRTYWTFFNMEFAEGWRWAFWFSVVLNVNFAILNLLPLPVLDGGHITLAVLEKIRKRPVSEKILEPIQSVAVILLLGFMLFILWFDIQDTFTGGSKRFKAQKPQAVEKQPAPEKQP